MNIQNRNIKIDLLKSLAIIFVIICHIRIDNQAKLFMLFPFWIDMAVPIFMILTAVNYTNSCLRKKQNTLKNCFTLNYTTKQIFRILPLFLILAVFVLFTAFQDIFITKRHTFLQLLFKTLGSYYPIVFLQIIFLLPVIYVLILKYKEKGLLIFSALQLFIESVWRLCEHFSDFNFNNAYRLLSFRYIIFLAVGCYYTLYKEKIKRKHLFISLLFGILYIVLFCMFDIKTLLFNTWTTTSMPTVLYIAPIVFIFLESKFTIKNKLIKNIVTLIGKSTYHIFIFQSAWYFYFYNICRKEIKSVVIFYFISIMLCTIFGIIAFLSENKIRQYIQSKRGK